MNKKYIILNFICGIFFISCGACFGQISSTSTASASATIISPVTVSQTNNIVFGNIPVPVNNSIAVYTAATPPVTGFIEQTSNGNLPVLTGATATASFKVSGQASSAYDVTIPSTSVTLSNGSDMMTAITYTTSDSTAGTQSLTRALSDKGSDEVKIVAALSLNQHQPAGLYTTQNPLKLTINYN